MKKLLLFWGLIGALAAGLACAGASYAQMQPFVKVASFSAPLIIQEFYSMCSWEIQTNGEGYTSLSGHCLRKPVVLSPEQRDQLKTLLLKAKEWWSISEGKGAVPVDETVGVVTDSGNQLIAVYFTFQDSSNRRVVVQLGGKTSTDGMVFSEQQLLDGFIAGLNAVPQYVEKARAMSRKADEMNK